MSLTLTGTGGIFTVFGPAFSAMDALNTARGTTIPPLTKAFQDAYQAGYDALPAGSQYWEIAMQAVPQGELGWQEAGAGYTSSLISAMQQLLQLHVRDDTDATGQTFALALEYLIADMIANSQTVEENVVSSTGVAAGAGNGSVDLEILYSLLGGSGKVGENAYPEDIRFTVSSTGRTPTLAIRTDELVSDLASHLWPVGSGVQTSISANDASTGGVVPNPSFEDSSNDLPESWFPLVGDSTSILTTDSPVHQVVVAGTPTSGSYLLRFTNPYDSRVTTTTTLPWNATAAQVRSALAAIPDLEDVTVTATGTSPNLTHTITLVGVGRAPSTMTAVNMLDTGSVTPSIVTGGDPHAYQGKAMYFLGDGAELTELQTELSTLSLNTTYFLTARMARNTTIAAGVIRFQILDAAGTVVSDGEGNDASVSITATTDLSSDGTFDSISLSFRAASDTQQPLTLQIKATTALTTDGRVYFDNVNIFAGSRLYSGGPSLSVIGGMVPAVADDTWTLPIANDYAGEFQTWFGRAFGMASLGLVLPSSGTATIPDSLI